MRNATQLLFSLLVLGLTLSLTTGLRAQSEAAKEEIIRPITKAGSAAFMFTINGLGDFKIGAPSINGMGSGVGAKWYVIDDLAIRVLLGLSSSQLRDSGSTALTTTSFGVGVGGEYHFRPLYSTSPYVGAQIGFTSTSQDIDIGALKIENDKTTTFSVAVIAGFDWFFTRGMAVGAELGLGFQSNGGTTAAGTSKTSVSTIALATNGNVHIIVYF